ncbi:MAG: metallophosphoesterase [Clostridia bacterium]|nr:metallophosphoesterase [Clostridia bacterium]
MIFITSDWHFCHNREFIWKARNFSSVNEMNEEIIKRNNKLVKPEDDLYVLGDLLLGGEKSLEQGLNLISRINGKLHLVRGNHCTDKRWEAFSKLPNVVETKNSIYLKHQGYHFYMSHFPSLTGNNDKFLKQMTLNLFGHTHQKEHFFENNLWMYNTAMDAHDCYPCNLNDIIQEMKTKWTDTHLIKEGTTPHDICVEPDVTKIKPYETWLKVDEYKRRQCARCVHEGKCSGPSWMNVTCPRDWQYRRDPPDGGYYG